MSRPVTRLLSSGSGLRFLAEDVCRAAPEWACLHEFPAIVHADLLKCPDEAVEVVTAFFQDVLVVAGTIRPLQRVGVGAGRIQP